MQQEIPNGIIEPEIEDTTSVKLPYKVILYNDEIHTFDEVINQLMKAIKCSFEEARAISFEVHVKGKAIVFSGELNNCLKVSSVLEEIALNTQIVS